MVKRRKTLLDRWVAALVAGDMEALKRVIAAIRAHRCDK